MKKITLLTLLCAMLAIPLGYSQSFSDGVDSANDQTHSALTTLDSPVFNVTHLGTNMRTARLIDH